jgi:hypothetical protein
MSVSLMFTALTSCGSRKTGSSPPATLVRASRAAAVDLVDSGFAAC